MRANLSGKRLALFGALLVAACDSQPETPPAARPPVAEFLLAAGDSTYWIRSGPTGIRVRSAPILLTRADNHFYEVYVVDDSREYEMATFAWVRLFSRDIAQTDSIPLFEDGRVFREATAWARLHRDAAPLSPDEIDDSSDPPTLVSDDIEIVDVHGPWLTFGHNLDIDIAGQKNHIHSRRRGVIDVRSGARATLASLFGDADAKTITVNARQSFAVLRDSIRATADERGALARSTLASFAFDTQSFGLTDVATRPAVTFMVPGKGHDGEALSLYLSPLSPSNPAWWGAVQPTLPSWSADSNALRWKRGPYDVVARSSASGDALTIVMLAHDSSTHAREWAIATVPSPAYQLIPLDQPPLDSSARLSLARAFDQSTSMASSTRRVSWQRSTRKKRAFQLTSYHTR